MPWYGSTFSSGSLPFGFCQKTVPVKFSGFLVGPLPAESQWRTGGKNGSLSHICQKTVPVKFPRLLVGTLLAEPQRGNSLRGLEGLGKVGQGVKAQG